MSICKHGDRWTVLDTNVPWLGITGAYKCLLFIFVPVARELNTGFKCFIFWMDKINIF